MIGDSTGHRPESLRGELAKDHETIKQLYRGVAEAASKPDYEVDRWQQLALSDTFLATVSRHLGAVEDVLYPAVRRHLPDGKATARVHARQAKIAEQTMRHVLASMYGEIHDLPASRERLWEQMRTRMESHMIAEEQLAASVDSWLSEEQRARLAAAYRTQRLSAPTRPHPYTPHSSMIGRLARRFWSLADRALDVMDGRSVPRRAPVPPPRPANLVSQYVTGSPTFDEDAKASPPERG